MKKLIDRVETVVDDACEGMALAHPQLVRFNREPRYLARAAQVRPGKVALISGGGAGHEPLHGGFVGVGMLDAACPGEVFASPVPDQMEAAAQAADGGAGVAFVVKNYTGDVMNFDLASELLGASGVAAKTVLVADDVAVKDSAYTIGRRGVGATLFVERLAGAAAERGANLDEVVRIGEAAAAASRSMGMALTSCTVPAKGSPTFALGPDEIEIGIGIHGEAGRERRAMTSADDVLETLVSAVADDLALVRGERVIALTNGMGGTPLIELYLAHRHVARLLTDRGVTIARTLVGNYVTSLDMTGCSVSLMRVDDAMLALWDEPIETPALRWGR